jgi:5-methylcytosine-specific restriction endonuclease McrA
MSERKNFHPKTMIQAWDRADGRCEVCTAKLFPGNIEYDHRIPCALGGDDSLNNCVVTCRACHAHKTYKLDIPTIAKTKRIRKRAAGIRKPRTIRRWRKFSGEIVTAPRER